MKTLALAAAALGLAAAADAATYTADVSAATYLGSPAEGLHVRAFNLSPVGRQVYTGSTVSFDLTDIGDSVTLDLFGLVSFEEAIDPDDLAPKPISVSFDFGSFSGTVAGTTAGGPAGGFADFGQVFVSLGGGLRMLISIADTAFASSGGTFTPGRPGLGTVTATFTLAPVPLPASLGLGAASLGLLGLLAWRRHRRAAA
jgi:hypothetical protein